MKRICVLALAIVLTAPLAGYAKKDKGRGKAGKGQADTQTNVAVNITVVFAPETRERVRTYFAETHGRGKCPPGLAKKGNGCLPPGQAKKRYAIGSRLGSEVELRPLPRDLSVRIGAPPAGYRYAIVDGDLVKLAVGTMLVADAIDGLVN